MASPVPVDQRDRVLNRFAYELSAASTLIEAARLLEYAADELIGWDCCFLELWDEDLRKFYYLHAVDIVDGKRAEVPVEPTRQPSPIVRDVAASGAKIILRDDSPVDYAKHMPFGDTLRRSASLLYVPVRRGPRAFGVFSAQSYMFNAYTETDLATLQALADHGAGALERIRAQERLRRSEERFRLLTANAMDIISTLRPDGTITYESPSIEHLLGWKPDELTEKNAFSLIHPDDQPLIQAVLKQALTARDQGSPLISYRFQRKDGSWCFLESLGRLATDSSGDTFIVVNSRDASERRETEQRLRESRDRLKLALEVASVATWEWNVITNEVFCSENLGPMFGLPAAAYYTDYRVFIAQILPEDRPDLEAALQRSVETGQPFSHEFRVERAPGSTAWVLSQGRGYSGPDGRVTRIVGATLDLTTRKLAEEALRISEERFSAVFHAGVAAIAIASLSDGRYLDVNQRWLDLLGFPREEAIGRTSLELGIWPHPEDRARFAAQLRAHSSLREWQCRWVRKDGRQIDALSSFEMLKIGDVEYVISITQDITEKINLETQLRQAQKMESIGQLAAGVAHDFNNILTIISGNVSLILEGGLGPEIARTALGDVQLAADRAAGLTRQLLTFSRRQVLQRRDLDFNEILVNITRMLMRVLGEHIELTTQLAADLPPIHADPGMMEQVVMNLAVNARDAMPKGGRLTLRTELVEPDTTFLRCRTEARRGRFVILTVTDTGTGIAPEHLPHIFEPFFTTKEVGQGTGLGLATVYGIVKQHDGWVEVESEPGRGATFRMYFPVAETFTTGPHRQPPARPSGGGERIFLAEDEPMVRSLTEQILQCNGYVVTSAANGVEAIQLWRARGGAFDLLLTDMVMPQGVTGSELAAELRRTRPDLKVLLMSGYSREIADPNLVLDSRTRFLQKPFLPDDLLRTLREVLDGVEV